MKIKSVITTVIRFKYLILKEFKLGDKVEKVSLYNFEGMELDDIEVQLMENNCLVYMSTNGKLKWDIIKIHTIIIISLTLIGESFDKVNFLNRYKEICRIPAVNSTSEEKYDIIISEDLLSSSTNPMVIVRRLNTKNLCKLID